MVATHTDTEEEKMRDAIPTPHEHEPHAHCTPLACSPPILKFPFFFSLLSVFFSKTLPRPPCSQLLPLLRFFSLFFSSSTMLRLPRSRFLFFPWLATSLLCFTLLRSRPLLLLSRPTYPLNFLLLFEAQSPPSRTHSCSLLFLVFFFPLSLGLSSPWSLSPFFFSPSLVLSLYSQNPRISIPFPRILFAYMISLSVDYLWRAFFVSWVAGLQR